MKSELDDEEIMVTNGEELSDLPSKLKRSKAIKKLPKKEVKPEVNRGLKIKSPKKQEQVVQVCLATYEITTPKMFKNDLNQVEKIGKQVAYQRIARGSVQTNEPCIVCWHVSGLKTTCTGGETVHKICGLLSDNFKIDYESMQMTLIEPINTQKEHNCQICGKDNGQLVRCLKKNCKHHVHIFCLMEHQLHQLQNQPKQTSDESSSEEDEEIIGWQLDIKVQDYSKQKFQNNYDCLQPMLDYLDFLEIERPQDLELVTAENTPEKNNLRPVAVQNKLPCRLNFPKRGGKISVVCEEHRQERQHCYCGNTSQQLHMIYCDYTQQWFHTRCEGLKSTEAQQFKEYKSTVAVSWSQKVNKVIAPALKGESDEILYNNQPDFSSWQCWKRSILPQSKLPVKLSDCTLVAQIWQKQTQQLLDNKVHMQMLIQQIIVAQHIPLVLDVSGINQRIKQVRDYQSQNPYKQYKLLPVVVGGMVDEKSVSENLETATKARDQCDKEMQACNIISFQNEQITNQIIKQNELITLSVKVFFRDEQITNNQLDEIIDELDAEVAPELVEMLLQLQKQTKKWMQFDIKSKTVEQVNQHLQQAPSKIKVCNGHFQQAIQELQEWEKQLEQLQGIERFNHFQSVHKLALKSDTTSKVSQFLKTYGNETLKFCQNADRRTTSQLQDLIAKLSPDKSEISQEFNSYLTQILNNVSRLKTEISDAIQGTKIVTLEFCQQLNEEAQKLPVLVQGEVILNQNIQVLLFLESKIKIVSQQHFEEFKCNLGDNLKYQTLKLKFEEFKQQIIKNQQDLDQVQEISNQSVEIVKNCIGRFEKTYKDIQKLGIISQNQDLSKVEQLITKLQQCSSKGMADDLKECFKVSKRETLVQLYNLLDQANKQLRCPVFDNLKLYLDELRRGHSVQSLLDKKICLKKLQEMHRTLTGELKDKVQAQIDLAKKWTSKLEQVQLTDHALRKKLANGEYQQLIDLAEELDQMRNDIKLEITDDQSKLLNRIKRWSSTVKLCHLIQQEEVDVDEMMALNQTLKDLKSLPQEIPVCKEAQDKIQQVVQFIQDFEKLVQNDPEDLIQQLKDKIGGCNVKLNISKLKENYCTQIDASEKWLVESESNNCDFQKLLQQLKDDKDGNLNLVGAKAIQKLKFKQVKNLFNLNLDVKQFVQSMERHKDVIQHEQLAQEKLMLDIARKIKMISDNKKVAFTVQESSTLYKQQLPFKIPKNVEQNLQQIQQKLENINKEFQLDFDLDRLDRTYSELKQLPVKCELQEQIQQRIDDIKFTVKLAEMIRNSDEQTVIMYDDVIRVVNHKIDCPETQICVEFFEKQKTKFDELRKKIDELKNEQYKYQQIYDAYNVVTELKVDFQKKERLLKSDLWQLKLNKLVTELQNKPNSDQEVVESEYLRYWLEEAQELELTKDPKYDTLNDLCDAVDHCYKAYKLVTTQKQFDELRQFVAQSVCCRLSFARVEADVKITNRQGDINPKAFLQRLLQQKKDDSDVQMTNMDVESSEASDGELTAEEEVKTKGKKREQKKVQKDDQLHKVSSKKIEELKKKVTLNKKVIKKEESAQKEVPGVSGVKIGGGIKSKLVNFKKKTFTTPKTKQESVPKAENTEVKAQEEIAKPSIKEKQPVKKAEKPKVENSNKVKQATAEKPVVKQSLVKKPIQKQKVVEKKPIESKQKVEEKQEQDTDAESPKQASKPAAKPIIGIKRKPLGGLAASLGKPSGLAASLKKLN